MQSDGRHECDATGRTVEKPLDVFALIFEQARGNVLVATGSRRPGKDGGDATRYLMPIPVRDLRQMLPGIFEYRPDQTQYFAARATFSERALLDRSLPHFADALRAGTPLYFGVRTSNVEELCAVAVDLDVGRDGLPSAEIALGVALDRCRKRILPWPHLGAFSGRGLYLFWLLTNASGTGAIPADRGALGTFVDVTRALCARLTDLKADAMSKNIVGWLKRPGTLDTKTGREVVYMRLGGEGVIPRRYTLVHLADSLSVALPLPPRRIKGPSRSALPAPRGPGEPQAQTGGPLEKLTPIADASKVKRGTGQAYQMHLDLENLMIVRGEIKEGCRHRFLWAWFHALRVQGYSAREARDSAWDLVTRGRLARGVDPVTRADIRSLGGAAGNVRAKRAWSKGALASLAEDLGVTPAEENEEDLLRQIVSLAERERRRTEAERERAARAERRRRARAEVEKLLRANPHAGDQSIADACGISRSTVQNWRRALGIPANPRGNKTARARRR